MDPSASDIRSGDWVDRTLPPPAIPYARLMRLDRPIGTWLLLLPCWWGTLAAAGVAGTDGLELLRLVVLFGIGALVMRGAGCTINDLWDRRIDQKVARTRTRPIASGVISIPQALTFLALQMLIGLGVLLQLGERAIELGLAVVALIVVYPLMKRVTFWPQLFLGLAFNWGVPVGWASVTGGLGWPVLAFYVAGVFWTLGYDTVYAHQDKRDDAMIGVKSSALLLGASSRFWISGFYATTTGLLALGCWLAGLGWPAWLGVAGIALHFAWQSRSMDLDNPVDCLRIFKSNRNAGLIFCAGLLSAWAI